MRHATAVLVGIAGLALPAAAQPLVQYVVETHAVNSFTPDAANGTEVMLYDGGSNTMLEHLGPQESVIGPGQSLVLRVRMHMPGHGQTFPGSGTLLLKAFGTATFDLSLANANGGTTTAGSAPLSPPLYEFGFAFSDWEDLVENFDQGTPNEAIFGADSITSIVPAQVPAFSIPFNFQPAPWVVDLIWTPSDYNSRTVGWSLSDGREVWVWGDTQGGFHLRDFETTLAGVSGEVTIIPAPAGLSLLAIGAAAVARRRR